MTDQPLDTADAQAPTAHPLAKQRAVVVDHSPNAMWFDSARFEHGWRVAQMLASSDFVPKEFRGKPENCLIGMAMANRFDMDPMMVLQNVYVIHGQPTLKSSFAIGLANSSGLLDGSLRFVPNGEGADLLVTCFGRLASTGAEFGVGVSLAQAVKAGWTKNSEPWAAIPQQMLSYRSAMFWIRLYAPEILTGLSSVEEAQDVPPPVQIMIPQADMDSAAAEARARIQAPESPQEAPEPQGGETATPPTEAPPAPAEAQDDTVVPPDDTFSGKRRIRHGLCGKLYHPQEGHRCGEPVQPEPTEDAGEYTETVGGEAGLHRGEKLPEHIPQGEDRAAVMADSAPPVDSHGREGVSTQQGAAALAPEPVVVPEEDAAAEGDSNYDDLF